MLQVLLQKMDPLVGMFKAFYVWRLVMRQAVMPRRGISMEGTSAVLLSLWEKPGCKFNFMEWTASIKRRAGPDLSGVSSDFWNSKQFVFDDVQYCTASLKTILKKLRSPVQAVGKLGCEQVLLLQMQIFAWTMKKFLLYSVRACFKNPFKLVILST